jgi:hypothetical protein
MINVIVNSFDFNFFFPIGHNPPISDRKGVANALRTNYFSQLMNFLPGREFSKCVHRYRGEYHIRTFSCFDQFLCMAFAQLTYRESLRDIEICLRAMQPKLYHAGIRGKVSRSTLADANEKRDWRIYADFAHVLIGMARELYVDEDFGLQITEAAYALDSTTIDLCLSLFPWASFRPSQRRSSQLKIVFIRYLFLYL